MDKLGRRRPTLKAAMLAQKPVAHQGPKAVCRAQRDWLEVLHDTVCLDGLNVSGLVWAEAVVRKLVQVETAVRRNPEQPGFEELDLLTTMVVDETGSQTTERRGPDAQKGSVARGRESQKEQESG